MKFTEIFKNLFKKQSKPSILEMELIKKDTNAIRSEREKIIIIEEYLYNIGCYNTNLLYYKMILEFININIELCEDNTEMYNSILCELNKIFNKPKGVISNSFKSLWDGHKNSLIVDTLFDNTWRFGEASYKHFITNLYKDIKKL